MSDRDFGVPLPGVLLDPGRWTSTFRADDGAPFDWDREFGRSAPRILDVGCGNGRFLLASAVARPEADHLGVEIVRPLAERAAGQADRRGLANVRVVAADAVAWLEARLDGLHEIHVYHPQPYYDPEDAARGMLTPGFFRSAWKALRPGGLLVLQTDDRSLGRYLLTAVRERFEPEPQGGPWPDAPLGRTRREILSLRRGRPVLRVMARRRDVPLEVPEPPPFFQPGRPGLRIRRRRS